MLARVMNKTPTPSIQRFRAVMGLALALALLLLFYVPELQRIPNGSSHYFMIDVGETQVVLNVWGTLHATGYPHYVMTGAALTDLLVALGMEPVTAPAVVSLMWGLLAAAVFYALALHLTGRVIPSIATVVLLGLARTVWVHHVIAEIYTFGLLILALLLVLALWRDEIPRLTTYPARIYWLAILGGLGLAHHRGFMVAIPALLYAVWPLFMAHRASLPRVVGTSLLLGLAGFLPYIYLPLRDFAGAAWVYGTPGMLRGFIDQFMGTEANRFIGLVETQAALRANFESVTNVLITDVTLPGLALGIAGLLSAVNDDRLYRAANTLILSAGAAYLFHVLFYTDTLSALILPVTVSLAFGWLFLLELALNERYAHLAPIFEARYAIPLAVAPAVLLLGVALYDLNARFIRDLTTDPTGVQTIEALEAVPDGANVLIAWGPRHFAAGFARDVRGELDHIAGLHDHNADVAALVATDAPLVTPEYSFFTQPLDWWEVRAGQPLYLRAVAPDLVKVAPQRVIGDLPPAIDDSESPLVAAETRLTCEADSVTLEVVWQAVRQPERDLSVFVHLRDVQGAVIAQDDRSAPVYGWRPVTTFAPGERVRDFYTLPRLANAQDIRYGLYYQAEDGAFVNVLVRERLLNCDDAHDPPEQEAVDEDGES